MVNEALAREVGWTADEAIGERLSLVRGSGTIVGVFRDFHYKSLHEDYKPMVFVSTPVAYGSAPLLLSLRVSTEDLSRTIAALEERWQTVMPDRPLEYSFLDAEFDKQYRAEQQLGGIFTAFGGLAILIACLGLFGLAALTAEQRTREIGIRKTLGASVMGVVGMLTGDFLKLIGIAIVLAVPITWLAAERWLDGFAYRTSVSIGLFLGTGLILAAIALLTVGYQSLRAAWTNPVDALRHP
jgi:putative ABC transport system permease protein